MANDINPGYVNEIEILMNRINEKTELHLKSIKEKSINEIMNGSIPKAQEMLESILPVQYAKEKLMNAQNELLGLLKSEKSGNKDFQPAALRIVNNTKSELPKSLNPNVFKACILKSLIYLGGNADIRDITEFVKQEILKSVTIHEKEKPLFEDTEKLSGIVQDESYRMLKEGFVIEDNLSKKWEILPAGIDFLSKYDIVAKSKAN